MEGPGAGHQNTADLMDRGDKKMRHHVREIECRVSGREMIRTDDGNMLFTEQNRARRQASVQQDPLNTRTLSGDGS